MANVTLEDIEIQEGKVMAVQFPNWTSTNHSHYSESHQEYTFSVVSGDYLMFNYALSSEPADYLIVKINGNIVFKEGGKKGGYFRWDFTESGDVTLYLSYNKNWSESSGEDKVSVTDIWLCTGPVLSLTSNGSKPLFADCPLDSLYIGRHLLYSTSSSYGYSPFYRNTSLRTVTITDTETEIYANEFYGCTNLKNVTMGNRMTSIGDRAFYGCSSLDYFEFGSAMKSIGKETFSDCTAMTKLVSHATTPPTCDSQALDGINKWICTLSVPMGYATAYQQADQWKDFFFINDDVEVPEDNNDDDVDTGVQFTEDMPQTKARYDLNGKQLSLPQRGLNIIRMNDGTTKKIIIK